MFRSTRVMVAVAVVTATLAAGIGSGVNGASAAGPPDWTHQFEIAAPAPDTGFGAAVAISGPTAVVGAPATDVDGKREVGAALLYRRSGTAWVAAGQLTEPAAEQHAFDEFAPAVAISGATIAVGAPNLRVGRRAEAGGVFVFRHTGGLWQQVAELRASDAAAGDHFGRSLAIQGSTIVVGAPEHTVGTTRGAGEAYVFADTGRGFTQTGLLASSDPSGEEFGTSVAISGATVVVGAPSRNEGEGAAYVFENDGGWRDAGQLLARDGGGLFGQSVAVSGATALIGAPRRSSTQGGAVYVFVDNGSAWKQRQQLRSPTRDFNLYGWSIAMSGSTALVSAHEEPAPGSGATGVVHVITSSGGDWANTATLEAADGVAGSGDTFGEPLAYDGVHGLVAGAGAGGGTGAAYVFG